MLVQAQETLGVHPDKLVLAASSAECLDRQSVPACTIRNIFLINRHIMKIIRTREKIINHHWALAGQANAFGRLPGSDKVFGDHDSIQVSASIETAI